MKQCRYCRGEVVRREGESKKRFDHRQWCTPCTGLAFKDAASKNSKKAAAARRKNPLGAQIVDGINAGKTQAELAKQLGVNSMVIYRALKDQGLKERQTVLQAGQSLKARLHPAELKWLYNG